MQVLTGLSKVQSRVLVTGGSGFIGRHLLALLQEHGHVTLNIDIKPSVSETSALTKLIDLRDAESLQIAVDRFSPDYVVHLAAQADIFQPGPIMQEVNIQGTRNLIKAMSDSVRGIVFVSTQLVVRMGVDPQGGTVLEPYTEYGETKAEMERIIRAECNKSWTIARPTNVWGPHHPSFSETIWKYLAYRYYLHPRTEMPILRSYIYVRNAVEQLYALMQGVDGPARENVYYISEAAIDSTDYLDAFSLALSGKPTRRVPSELLWSLAQIGERLRQIGLPFPLDKGRYERMTTDYIVPIDAIYALAGPPRITLPQGVACTVNWLNSEKRFLQPT